MGLKQHSNTYDVLRNLHFISSSAYIMENKTMANIFLYSDNKINAEVKYNFQFMEIR
jgi:hypothetical protein